MPRSLKLTERYDEAHNLANTLALVMAFSGVGLVNALVKWMLLGGFAHTLPLWH